MERSSLVELRLSREREGFVRRCVESGICATPSDVVEAALRLFEMRTPLGDATRIITLGFEQVIAGRASYLTGDDVKMRAFRRERSE